MRLYKTCRHATEGPQPRPGPCCGCCRGGHKRAVCRHFGQHSWGFDPRGRPSASDTRAYSATKSDKAPIVTADCPPPVIARRGDAAPCQAAARGQRSAHARRGLCRSGTRRSCRTCAMPRWRVAAPVPAGRFWGRLSRSSPERWRQVSVPRPEPTATRRWGLSRPCGVALHVASGMPARRGPSLVRAMIPGRMVFGPRHFLPFRRPVG